MNIGEKIRMRRKELGFTTEELGRMIGVQRTVRNTSEHPRDGFPHCGVRG